MSRVFAVFAVATLAATLLGGGHGLIRSPRTPAPSAVAEGGVIALPAARPDRVRLLYARNGGMVVLGEIAVPGRVRDVSLSADGSDVFVSTDDNAYTLSTRTGRIEAQLVAAAETGKASAPSVERPGG